MTLVPDFNSTPTNSSYNGDVVASMRAADRSATTALAGPGLPGDRPDAPSRETDVLAPWPQIDRYPTVVGSGLSFTYLSACQRQATGGYRLQWIDLLRELLRRDPSAYGNLEARILATAGGKVDVVSAAERFPHDDLGNANRERVEEIRKAAGLAPSLPEMSEDERLLADQIAAHVRRQIRALPRLPQILAQQLWAIYFGVSANELLWERAPTEWRVRRLHYIHPRRISYPEQTNWNPHVWDQGLVVTDGPGWQQHLTSGMFGLDLTRYPNKFLVHVPEVLSGYPTEDGLGFVIAWYMAAKLMGARSYFQFIERYAKPGTIVTYNTSEFEKGPRNATSEDIALGQQIALAMSQGVLPGVEVPDSLKIEMFGPAAGLKSGSSTADPKTFVEWCDDQIARAIRTTDALQGLQKNGARSALEVLAKGANRVAFYDAMGLSGTWTRDFALPVCRLNYPALERLAPAIVLHVDDEPGPEVLLDRMTRAAAINMPLDADRCAEALGMGGLLVAKEDREARRLYPLKAVEIVAPDAPPPEEESEEDDAEIPPPDRRRIDATTIEPEDETEEDQQEIPR